jgi:phosphoketolase
MTTKPLIRACASIICLGILVGCASHSAVEKPPSQEINAANVAGIWMQEVVVEGNMATSYSIFGPDGTCRNVLKNVREGTTSWIAFACSWSVDGNLMSVKINKTLSPDIHFEDGDPGRITMLTATTLTVDGGGQITSTHRQTSIPTEFADHMVPWDSTPIQSK